MMAPTPAPPPAAAAVCEVEGRVVVRYARPTPAPAPAMEPSMPPARPHFPQSRGGGWVEHPEIAADRPKATQVARMRFRVSGDDRNFMGSVFPPRLAD